MKTSIVISMKKVISKSVLFLVCGIFLTGIFRWNLPSQLFQGLTRQMVKKVSEAPEPFSLSSALSFQFPQTVYAAMPSILSEKKAEQTAPVATAAPENTASPEDTPASTDLSNQKSSNAATNHGIIVKNHAGKNFQLEELLQKPLPYDPSTGGYKVLIVHSHTSESYFPNDRSDDETKNMIAVGKAFTAVLEENGIQTLHITKVHDVPYTTSYKKSLESVTAALAEHPSIEVVIDVHRDALYNDNNEKIKPLATINGISAAQVMVVTGTEKGGLPHPNWADNLAFSLKVQNDMIKNYPNLARPVDLRKERFNTHTTKNSIIFEIGANGNTIEEAIAGARFAAQSVANVLTKK